MNDFTNGNNSNHYNPGVYIKTRSGFILAFIKIMEAIAASVCLIVLFIGINGIFASLNNFFLELSQTLSTYLPPSLSQTPGFLTQLPLLLPSLFLLLIIFDGIGIFLMRFANRGESLVRFVHIICWILSLIEIILFIAAIVLSVLGISRMNDATGGFSRFIKSIGAAGIFIYPLFALYFEVLLFKCRYHRDICTVLKTVHEEKQTGQLAVVGQNNFMGRTGWLAWSSGIIFVFTALILIYPLITHKQLVPEESWHSVANLAPVITQTIICLFSFLVFLKYLSLRICARNFQKYHDNRGGKTSALLIIILVIILCIAAYAIGKNNVTNNILNQESLGNDLIVQTSTPSTTIKNISPSATTDLGRNSLTTSIETLYPTKVSSNSGIVDPDLKEFLDGYEEFMDQYVAFMKRYAANPADLSLLAQYYSMLTELDKYSEAADRWSAKETEMSSADLAYYTATMLRINNKMISVY